MMPGFEIQTERSISSSLINYINLIKLYPDMGQFQTLRMLGRSVQVRLLRVERQNNLVAKDNIHSVQRWHSSRSGVTESLTRTLKERYKNPSHQVHIAHTLSFLHGIQRLDAR